MGWEALGLDPDPAAVNVARGRGLNIVHGGVESLADKSACFDAITLSHVIEHVHQPREFLRAVNRLLKVNGIVYIDTPNIQSQGAKFFGKNWRGIEAPRHLTLFNPDSLKDLLVSCAFHDIEFRRRTDVQIGMWRSSMKSCVLSPHESDTITPRWWYRYLMINPFVNTYHLEYITLTARKKSP